MKQGSQYNLQSWLVIIMGSSFRFSYNPGERAGFLLSMLPPIQSRAKAKE